ncbi:glycoside hydrolase family 72 protein [Hypoxylon cercidicola]|nr:glycoside hydrolase family 72 protein [Hypoxylon cercidicola]
MEKPVIPVTVKGRYFWKGDKRFIVNGVVYQLGKVRKDRSRIHLDPLADDQLETLQRSIPLLKELRLNALFVYYVDETKNHDAAMTLLADAGIYVLASLCGQRRDLSCYRPSETYTPQLLASCFRAIDVMSQYPNTLGFVIANEFINSLRVTSAANYLRALTRDVKKYIALAARQNQRVVPVGISAADISYLLKTQFDYFSAGSDEEAIDFFSFNNSNCVGQWSMIKSGGASLADIFRTAHIPVFFSQYGFNDIPCRPFFNTRAIYTNDDMLRVFSGGIANEFFDGLVRRSTSGGTVKIKKLDDFGSLKTVLGQFFPPILRERIPKTPPEEELFDPSYAFVSLGDCEVTVGASTPERPQMPRRTADWQASHKLPASPMDWAELEERIEENIKDSEWTDVQKEILDMAVDDLAFGIRDRLIIDDDGCVGNENGGDHNDYNRGRTCRVS